MKTKLLQEFLNSNLIIKSQEKLEQYIDYCMVNNQEHRIKGKTSHHHILPEALFDEYSNLKENSWNGTYLLYYEHYYTHWLLTEAIDDYGQLHAFTCMHYMDIKNGRVKETDLIPKEEFQLKMEERSIKQSNYLLEEIFKKGILQSRAKHNSSNNHLIDYTERAKKMSSTKSSKEWKVKNEEKRLEKYNTNMQQEDENGKTKFQLSSEKMVETRKENGSYIAGGRKTSETKYKIQENGKTGHQNISEKRQISMNEKDKDGNNKYHIAGIKSSATKNKINPKTGLTNAKEAGLKLSTKLRAEAVKYDVVHINGETIMENIILGDLPTQGLKGKTKEDYFGKSNISKKRAIKYKIGHLIGCYLIKKD